MKKGNRYSIGEVEEICNVPKKTLRYYDDIKLVVPEFRDEDSKYRYYSKDQMVTLCIIRKLRMYGFKLKKIKEIIDDNSTETLRKNIEHKLLEISEKIKTLQNSYYDGHTFLKRLKEGADLTSYCSNENVVDNRQTVQIEEIPEMHLVYTKKVMKKYSNSEVSIKRWVEIVNLCNKLHLKSKGLIIVTYHSNPLEQFLFMDSEIEFGMLIDSPVDSNTNAYNYRKFGGFTAATTTHIGNYSNIINTHIKLIQWINKNGYKISGNVSEEFIISPLDVNNVDEHITKVIIPVVKMDKSKS
ncbi:MerR family transcriptional regulator [Maledivibacter halophilus]|uniref:DNA-binding transcriptional regulator, MerR family n=1 Tax=Maledivibacter halophilus TaxID=36842 RepID=A0A1T5LLX5_9FIRM|nr:MerR family transcriptional regulator [Maledivibacter halophilus]SKC77033.1 DNA-binding transcriptional regulator, MerR family [Maledivibacter halophilus]